MEKGGLLYSLFVVIEFMEGHVAKVAATQIAVKPKVSQRF
jgi:hypothetical protein